MVVSKQTSAPNVSAAMGKTTGTNSVAPVQLGRASNAYSSLLSQQNQVYADDSANLVTFIHRQDVSIWGGGSTQNGMLRYDISANGGLNFNSDIGTLNPTYSQTARYPQMTGYRVPGSYNPLAVKLPWMAPTLDAAPAWNGYVNGVADAVLANPVASTESYAAAGLDFLTMGGLCEGVSGEFWSVSFHVTTGGTINDTLDIYKGTWNGSTQDVVWGLHDQLVIPHYTGYDGTAQALSPNIAFSPDGSIGWIGFLGDLVGGTDSVLHPIVIQSTNGGNTWGSPIEVDMQTIPWLSDSLQALWVDSTGGPVSTGRAACAFDFDLTVDMSGNPHFFTTVATATTTTSPLPTYSVFSGLAKYAVDFTSSTNGATWGAILVAPVLTFRGEFGTGSTLLSMDNCNQVSRSPDGTYIYYAWVDSDTSVIGFGESTNLAPNLMVASVRMTDGFRTCYRNISGNDIVWEGRALFPTMAPVNLIANSGLGDCHKLPIVMFEMIINDVNGPTAYWYWGNEATFDENDYHSPEAMDLSWTASCYASGCDAFDQFNSISGTVWADSNGNGIKEPSEPRVSGVVVSASPGPWNAVTDSAGNYAIFVPAGTYTVGMNPPSYFTLTAPSGGTYSVTFTGNSTNDPGNDFGIEAIANMLDVGVWGTSGFLRPGFNAAQSLTYKNVGTMFGVSGTVTYVYDSVLTFNSSVPVPTSHNAATRTLTYDYTGLNPQDTRTISMDYTVANNVALLGTNTEGTATITPVSGDQDLLNNTFVIHEIVRGAYDPNDKAVFPEGMFTPDQIAAGEMMTYRIRFQNTGTDTAFTVVVQDSLSEYLDFSTFEMISASHPYTMTARGNTHVTWTFPNILLPDSNVNEPASHGYILFQIRPRAGAMIGTEIENEAGIYFDFNPPVITNLTYSVVDTVVGRPKPAPDRWQVTVYPNPFDDNAMLYIDGYDGRPYELAIYDLTGRAVRQTRRMTTPSVPIDRTGMTDGIYFFRMTRDGQVVGSGKFVVQ